MQFLKKQIPLLLCLFLLFASACKQTNSENTKAEEPKIEQTKSASVKSSEAESKKSQEPEKKEAKGAVYRADGKYPGIVSEWVQINLDVENQKIRGIWYWNSSDEKKIELPITAQSFEDGEISGYVGKLNFPMGSETIPAEFGIIEDRFTLTLEGDAMYEFYFEDY